MVTVVGSVSDSSDEKSFMLMMLDALLLRLWLSELALDSSLWMMM